MKKLKGILLALLVVGVVVAVLINNKAKSDEKLKQKNVSIALPVSVFKADRQEVAQNLSLVGTVVPNGEVMVVSETQGRITGLYTDIGDYMRAGATIAQVDDELKRAALMSAEVNLEKAQSDQKRYEQLYAERSIPEQQLEGARLAVRAAEAQIITARRLLRDTRITAPISGVVTARPVHLGTTLSPGTAVVNIVDVSRLKAKVNVAESDVFDLHVGDRVSVTTDIHPNVEFDGTIKSIGAKSDEAHTYPVEIVLSNSGDHPLKAGMFIRVAFTSIPNVRALVIPRSALIGSIQKPQVFVAENGLARLRSIVVTGEMGTNVLVREGITEGELVVVDGQNNLTDNVQIQIVK